MNGVPADNVPVSINGEAFDMTPAGDAIPPKAERYDTADAGSRERA